MTTIRPEAAQIAAQIGGRPTGCPQDVVGQTLDAEPLEVRAVSAVGSAHAMFGEPRQDSFAIAAGDDWVVLVVADGIGSCPASHHGSAAAAASAAEALVAARVDPLDATGILTIAALACLRASDDVGVRADDVSTTLTVAAVERAARVDGSRRVVVHAVGDSPALLLEPATALWSYLTSADDGPGNVVHSWLPGRYDNFFSTVTELPAGSVLVLASDGFTTPLGDGTGPLGQDLASRWRRGPRALFPFMVDLSFEGYHDDRTVVALWNPLPFEQVEVRSGEPDPPPV